MDVLPGTEGAAVTQFEVPPVVPADPSANISDLLADRVAGTPDRIIFALPDGPGWRDVTAAAFEGQVIALAKGFVAAGIQPGDRVGFLARPPYDWTLGDFALFFARALLVPLYQKRKQ